MSGLSCGSKMLSYLMFFMNFIFWMVGGTMLGIGIWLAVDDGVGFLEDLIEDNPMDDPLWSTAVYTIIAVGAFVFLLGFLGCCGASTQSSCMMCAYQVIVIIVLIAEVVCVILVLIFRSDIDESFEKNLLDTVLTKYGQSDQDVATNAQDKMQRNLYCCGAAEPEDYLESRWFYDMNPAYKNTNYTYANGTIKVPRSCCRISQEEGEDMEAYFICNEEVGHPLAGYFLQNTGCTQQVRYWIEDNAIIFIAVVSSFVGLEIFGLIFACCLKSSFNKVGDVV